MITFKQFIVEAPVKLKQNQYSLANDIRERFKELGAEDLFRPFFRWFVSGIFSASPAEMEELDNAFHGMKSLIPNEILKTYKSVGTVYRAFNLADGVSKADVMKDGLNIKNQIGAWTPSLKRAREYKSFSKDRSIVLQHKPKPSEILVFLNQATVDFFHMPMELVANPGEVILSLPISRITPDMIKENQA